MSSPALVYLIAFFFLILTFLGLILFWLWYMGRIFAEVERRLRAARAGHDRNERPIPQKDPEW